MVTTSNNKLISIFNTLYIYFSFSKVKTIFAAKNAKIIKERNMCFYIGFYFYLLICSKRKSGQET
jgi:hypothetical protein